MSNEIALVEDQLIAVLESSIYPGASKDSISLAVSYCKATSLDVMQKPVHIVPMWDRKLGRMRDVIMPGIGLYRIQAARTGQFAGMTEPEFGPMVTEKIDGVKVEYPEYCRVTAKRILANGVIAEFSVIEYWIENYAIAGGKEKSIAPNAMWAKRPRGQLAKCAQAQALRLAFPEIGAAPTAEEVEGRQIVEKDMGPAQVIETVDVDSSLALISSINSLDELTEAWKGLAAKCRDTKDMSAYAAIKDAVAVRGNELKTSEPAEVDDAPF